eukprot:SM000115S23932  [mRNA]  locus=s115:403930:406604:+ [translate_table: standard]
MGLDDCLEHTWPHAAIYLDDRRRRKRLDRAYGRVDRTRLKSSVMRQCVANGVAFHAAKVDSVEHGAERSEVLCSDGTRISGKVVLDATGFSRRLVQFDAPFQPGFQAAYGILAHVASHPFPVGEMVLMDWRDSHLADHPALRAANKKLPSFLYVMPFSDTRIFLEETSLVARPGIPFEDLQERLVLRLRHLGISVQSIEEDEYCLIPMGGILPVIPQRVLGIGGTAGMVHPSTGYMVARTLAAAPQLAASIVERLGRPAKSEAFVSGKRVTQEDEGSRGGSSVECSGGQVLGEELSAGIWEDIWPVSRVEQREFFCFGMDVLLKVQSFVYVLGQRLSSVVTVSLVCVSLQLIKFGLSLFAHATNASRFEIVRKGLPGLLTLIQNLVKLRQRRMA